MRFRRTSGWSLLAGGLLAALVVGCGHAKEEGKHVKTYKATIHNKDGSIEELIFTPGSKDDAHKLDKFQRALSESEAEELIEHKAVNLMELRWDLGLYTVVVFVLLFLILRKAAWGPMLEGLQKREENILGALSEAQKAREEAKGIREQLQKELDNASQKVHGLLDEARKDASKLKDDMVADARKEIQTERDRLHREIGTAKDQALKDIWDQTAQLATLVSAKAIQRELGADDHRRLVDEALAEMHNSTSDLRKEVWGKKA
jgi:F-type H+-transporting ATPase subunit b